MPLLFIFLLFCNIPCWHWWHSQVSWLFNYVSFQSRISNQLLAVNARNSLNSLRQQCRAIQSQKQLEPFITPTKAASVAVLQELSENNLNLQFAGAENEQAVDNFNFRTEDLSTDLHVYIQRRFRARDHYCNSQGNSVEE